MISNSYGALKGAGLLRTATFSSETVAMAGLFDMKPVVIFAGARGTGQHRYQGNLRGLEGGKGAASFAMNMFIV